MKNIYFRNFLLLMFLLIQLLSNQKAKAQCPYGITPGQVSYDTTIITPAGINTLLVKFPQANPFDGLLTCLRLCITITGVVDSVSVENNSASPQTADVYYIRTDQINGPGLSGPLTNSINYHYGPFALGATNGVLGSGPDFTSISKDTLLNAVTNCTTITNADSLFQFYGQDSVTYLYNITAFTNVTCTGGNYNSSVSTSALVRFRFEYCTCPGLILPLGISDFKIERIAENRASLIWNEIQTAENSAFHYEVEMSRDGKNFTSQGILNAGNPINTPYRFIFSSNLKASIEYYFRIRQVFANGYSRFSEIRRITLKNSQTSPFILYPNPSNSVVGIKFDNIQSEKKVVEIFNSQAQKVISKEIVVSGSFYQLATPLQKGMYWIRVRDVATGLSSVNQLFIK